MSGYNFPSADFLPQLAGYTGLAQFRFWCQKVLPIVYDDSLSYYELLNKVVVYLNNIIKDVATCEDNIDTLATAFRLLQEYVENYTLVVNPETVEEILKNHPEWTTTVQDGSIQFDKLSKDLHSIVGAGATVTPSYVGDFITYSDMLPSACLKTDGGFIVIEASTTATANEDNSGVVREFGWEWDFYNRKLIKNEEYADRMKVVDLGHANSIAFDGEHIWVAPVWDYTQYSSEGTHSLYMYDRQFEIKQVISTPITPHAVTFDPITKNLYFCNYYSYLDEEYTPDPSDVYVPPDCCRVYKLDGSRWVKYCDIKYNDLELFNTKLFTGGFQDFAVYNSQFYLSSPYGTIYCGGLYDDVCELNGCLKVAPFDSRGWFQLGELEGMEFDEKGHLYAVMYIRIGGLSDYIKNAFIVELNVGTAEPITYNYLGPIFDAQQDTLALSESSVKCFSLGTNQIRCLQQLGSMLRKPARTVVNIPSGNTIVEQDWTVQRLKKYLNGETGDDAKPIPRNVMIRQSLQLNPSGVYDCNSFDVEGGELELYASSSSSSSNKIICRRAASESSGVIFRVRAQGGVKFTGSVPVQFDLPNIGTSDSFTFIDAGAFGGSIFATTMPVTTQNHTLKIGNVLLEARVLYQGFVPVNRIAGGTRVELKCLSGVIYTQQRCTFRAYVGNYTPGMNVYSGGRIRIATPTGFLNVVIDANGNTINTFLLGNDPDVEGGEAGYKCTIVPSETGKFVDINFLFVRVQSGITVGSNIVLTDTGSASQVPYLGFSF